MIFHYMRHSHITRPTHEHTRFHLTEVCVRARVCARVPPVIIKCALAVRIRTCECVRRVCAVHGFCARCKQSRVVHRPTKAHKSLRSGKLLNAPMQCADDDRDRRTTPCPILCECNILHYNVCALVVCLLEAPFTVGNVVVDFARCRARRLRLIANSDVSSVIGRAALGFNTLFIVSLVCAAASFNSQFLECVNASMCQLNYVHIMLVLDETQTHTTLRFSVLLAPIAVQ